MNLRPLLRLLGRPAILAGVFLSLCSAASAQTNDSFFYLVGPGSTQYPGADQGFVIEVNATQAAEIEAILASGAPPGFSGTIAAGSVDYNRDYYAPGQPVWNWHVVSVNSIFDFTKTLFPACVCPFLISKPSDIAANPDEWIRNYGTTYLPLYYSIQHRIDPAKRTAMANISNRGVTGQDERKLITGLIITGGTPRNIVVRALGPSLGPVGVLQPAGNPKLEVYDGDRRIAANADWKEDRRADLLAQKFPVLVPANDKEAALWLTLLPGTYTIQASNQDGTEGIVLVEAYDVDSESR